MYHHVRRPHRISVVATAAALAAAALVLGTFSAGSPAGAATKLTMFGGYAYDTNTHIGSSANTGRSAVATLCTSSAGVTHTNHSSATDIPNAGNVGAVTTQLTSRRPASGPVSTATTSTHGLALFGMISATTLTTTARVAHTAHGYVRTGSTNIVGLHIAGHSSPPANPTVDQTVKLPGIATIVFNHHAMSQHFGNYKMTVVAMTITVPKTNTLHLPAMSIVVGHGVASLHRPTFANVHGYAFGTTVGAAKVSGSNRTAPAYLPCGGTDGSTTHNRTSSARVPSALQTGETTSTTRSVDTATSTLARTSNTIANASLFGGVIKAGAVHVVASAARNSSGALTRKATATVGGLTVNGQSKSGTAPANTKIAIPNLGTLWVHRVINTPSGITVRGLDLILSVTKNGFKKGTELIIGAANAAASSS